MEVIRRLLKLDTQLLSEVFKADPDLPVSVFTSLVKAMRVLLLGIHNVSEKFNRRSKSIFEVNDGWVSFLSKGGVDNWNSTGRISPDFYGKLQQVFLKIDFNDI
jgi:hypothetical protein